MTDGKIRMWGHMVFGYALLSIPISLYLLMWGDMKRDQGLGVPQALDLMSWATPIMGAPAAVIMIGVAISRGRWWTTVEAAVAILLEAATVFVAMMGLTVGRI